jgi:uncharacterized protein
MFLLLERYMNKIIYDHQFSAQGIQIMPKQKQTIYVVIAKPTRFCNADCSYCSSPPMEEMGANHEASWNIEKFKKYFDKVYPHMVAGSFWIWHGGEPMLMGTEFYKQTYEYAQEKIKETGRPIYFSMQTNLLAYSDKWYPIFSEIFGGSISSSFDADETQRTIKGSTETFSRVFKRSLTNVLEDGFRPMVIGVYTEETAPLMHKMYDWSKSLGDLSFPLRFNYCHPTGRLESSGEAISPITYGKNLVELYNKWIIDVPNFTITPLDQMFKKVIGMDGEGHCPWTKKCGGRFVEIEPNGDVYNCADFADLGNKYCFGNMNTEMTIEQMFASKPALQIRRRVNQVPVSCQTCEHFDDCEGGCMRDSVLYKHGLYGKFHYCQSWKMVFSRIKESIINGEADNIIIKYGFDPKVIQNNVKNNIQNYFDFSDEEWNNLQQNGLINSFGFGDNYNNLIDSNYTNLGEYKLADNSQSLFDVTNDPEFQPVIINANQKLQAIKLKIVQE